MNKPNEGDFKNSDGELKKGPKKSLAGFRREEVIIEVAEDSQREQEDSLGP